jgi:hypothetical protein
MGADILSPFSYLKDSIFEIAERLYGGQILVAGSDTPYTIPIPDFEVNYLPIQSFSCHFDQRIFSDEPVAMHE